MCGIALIRLKKPLSYYRENHGSVSYGLDKLYLLMEKQHNRGQDGAGIAVVNMDVAPGQKYVHIGKSAKKNYLQDVFNTAYKGFKKGQNQHPENFKDDAWINANVDFHGQVFLGHLRYGTHGDNSIATCHPFVRYNNWRTRTLVSAGNFNLTNVHQLFSQLEELGQYPREKTDNETVLEKVGHFLDDENQHIFDTCKDKGFSNPEISRTIAEKLNLQVILRRSVKDFDGGFAFAGITGHGDAYALRDPHGIRPLFYFEDDEVVVAASERPAIQTAFNLDYQQVQEVLPAHALLIKGNGKVRMKPIGEPKEKKSCSFERIYFSRGTDKDIYEERSQLGYQLSARVLEAVDYNFEETVFSFIPNTAETAFYGLVKGVEDYLTEERSRRLKKLDPNTQADRIQRLLHLKPRVEKIAVKDAKLRTFITEDSARDDMVSHVYDITYGVVAPGKDTLVVVDDSIVRGTTLKKSILRILDRLQPKKIIVVSSAPQIRYPDCYGIDMSKLSEFVAFKAAINIREKRGEQTLIDQVYQDCIKENTRPKGPTKNCVREIYKGLKQEEIEKEIANIVTSKHLNSEVQIIYQDIEGLHAAIPKHKGDWYFTGNFPTLGGMRVVNQSFINFVEGKNVRAYS